MDVRELDRVALASTRDVIDGIAVSDLERPTPCAEWDVRALLNHVIGGNHLFAAAALGSPAWSDRELDWLGDDLGVAYEQSTGAVSDAFAATPDDAEVKLPFGPTPLLTAIAIHFVDVLVHGWDLAVATSQRPALPDGVCSAALEIVALYPEDTWGDPEFFTAKIELASSAPVQDRLVATLGRHPDWAP